MALSLQQLIDYFWPGGTAGQYRGTNGEAGVDVSLPAGTPIYSIQGGYYSPYSTQYQTIVDVQPGLVEYYQHIDAAAGTTGSAGAVPGYHTGEFLPAGSLLGYVGSETGSYTGTNSFGDTSTYHSTGPHVEYGAGPSDPAVFNENPQYTFDPTANLNAIYAGEQAAGATQNARPDLGSPYTTTTQDWGAIPPQPAMTADQAAAASGIQPCTLTMPLTGQCILGPGGAVDPSHWFGRGGAIDVASWPQGLSDWWYTRLTPGIRRGLIVFFLLLVGLYWFVFRRHGKEVIQLAARGAAE